MIAKYKMTRAIKNIFTKHNKNITNKLKSMGKQKHLAFTGILVAAGLGLLTTTFAAEHLFFVAGAT